MVRKIKTLLALAALAFTFGAPVYAQDSTKNEEKAKTLETGSFHGNVHGTSGRATPCCSNWRRWAVSRFRRCYG